MLRQNASAMDWLVWGIPIVWGYVFQWTGVFWGCFNELVGLVISVDSVVWVMNWTGSLDWVVFFSCLGYLR